MNTLSYILRIHNFGKGRFMSTEFPGKPASNSEIRRWINQGVVFINGERVEINTWIDFDNLKSVIIRPNNKNKRITVL